MPLEGPDHTVTPLWERRYQAEADRGTPANVSLVGTMCVCKYAPAMSLSGARDGTRATSCQPVPP
jgi:hypothetical protein